jgi:hypothetical protein
MLKGREKREERREKSEAKTEDKTQNRMNDRESQSESRKTHRQEKEILRFYVFSRILLIFLKLDLISGFLIKSNEIDEAI